MDCSTRTSLSQLCWGSLGDPKAHKAQDSCLTSLRMFVQCKSSLMKSALRALQVGPTESSALPAPVRSSFSPTFCHPSYSGFFFQSFFLIQAAGESLADSGWP